jgi:hypothetical protein
MTTTDKEAKSLLGGFEALFGNPSHGLFPDNLALINKVLLQLFEADVVEEEFLLDWGAHVSSKVRLSPFLRSPLSPVWLEEGTDQGCDAPCAVRRQGRLQEGPQSRRAVPCVVEGGRLGGGEQRRGVNLVDLPSSSPFPFPPFLSSPHPFSFFLSSFQSLSLCTPYATLSPSSLHSRRKTDFPRSALSCSAARSK